MLPKNRAPTSPGEVLEEEFLKPMGLTQVELAKRMGIPIQRLNTVVTGKRAVSAETAILLAGALGTSPNFWMNLQTNLDLWRAAQVLAKMPSAKGLLAKAAHLLASAVVGPLTDAASSTPAAPAISVRTASRRVPRKIAVQVG